ncbi:MAG: ATPase [uncultured DHVE6 group euryarchaeote]|nr:MAG: ATPase [uncultured DHVE6 group euryarchaeote]
MLIRWKKIAKLSKLIPDTSAIINQSISEQLEAKKISFSELIVHRALLSELENQANQGKDTGFLGFNELKLLKELSKKHKFKITHAGDTPSLQQIKMAKRGAIDEMIRNLALDENGTLFTSDKVQAEVAQVSDIKVIYVASVQVGGKLTFEKYFKEGYMSVHLKQDTVPRAKAGSPGQWEFLDLAKKKLKEKDLEKISSEIVDAARTLEHSFLERSKRGHVIAQIRKYRIVITRPPLSDAWEITIVRPVKKLDLSEYQLSQRVQKRLSGRAEGMLIAGSPGSGKSTFAQALAKTYADSNKVVKSLESPRDMQLPPSVTQYSLTKASHNELRDILLLTRPDYTIYDEVRNLEDFSLFADLRLAGVGMAGVVHASNPIDSIQRFIGKIEVGMIPSIIDTVIFIKEGQVQKVYGLRMGVKVPSGLREKDLARPVVDIYDFDTEELEYEIYSFGDSTVVMPIKKLKRKSKKGSNTELRWRMLENSKFFEFMFFTPTKRVSVVINNILVTKLPVQKGRSLRIMKKSSLGKEIKHALRNRLEVRFE